MHFKVPISSVEIKLDLNCALILLMLKEDSNRMAMGSSYLIYVGGYKLDTKINDYFNYTQLYLY